MFSQTSSSQFHWGLQHLKEGRDGAIQEIVAICYERVRVLSSRMLRRFPSVKRWEDTDDLLQNVMVRLSRSLKAQVPGTSTELLKLCSTLIRRELIDLARHWRGPLGMATHYASPPPLSSGEGGWVPEGIDSDNPEELMRWSEFFNALNDLPQEELETFQLVWYCGLPQAEAADLLGISLRTFKRRWQAARLRLAELYLNYIQKD